MTGSLAFRTDLALLARQGARIEGAPDRAVVRMPENPGFRWGNFLLVPTAGDPAERIAEHAGLFPGARFTTVGVDDPHPVLDDGAWLAAGFGVERLAVLVASVPPAPGDAAVRPLDGARDWAAETAIALALEDDADPGHEAFTRRRSVEKQRLVASGRAVWLGVEVDGRIVATAGVADAGDRVARFQDVQTVEAFRRRGFAGALVAEGARTAAERFGSTRWVLVADREGPAIGLYRRLGFREVETQLQLTRLEDGVGGGA